MERSNGRRDGERTAFTDFTVETSQFEGSCSFPGQNSQSLTNATGSGCPYGTTTIGQVTAGNSIITGEKKGTRMMVNLKWDE
jgi:hypothetical protein